MVSIAIPASCIGQASCKDLRDASYALYQISRACVSFSVEEIIIYDSVEPPSDLHADVGTETPKKIKLDAEPEPKATAHPADTRRNPDMVLCANLLQFLITPKHLRRVLFKPIGNARQFKYARQFGKIPGLLDVGHITQGIAVRRERKKKLQGQKKLSKRDRREAVQTPYVNVGFDKLLKLRDDTIVPVNSRVFIDLKKGKVVDEKSTELSSAGTLGYSVRAVSQFSHMFTQSPLKDGYKQSIYVPCQQFKSKKPSQPLIQAVALEQVDTDGLLVVFGSWSEVQQAVSNDEEVELDDASALFDGVSAGLERYRPEDAIMVTLARLKRG